MIFAKLNYSDCYEDVHDSVSILLEEYFDNTECGLQCDSWIWVRIDEAKVAVDTFTAMTHEVKSDKPGKHVEDVISVLSKKFSVDVYAQPEPEAHE